MVSIHPDHIATSAGNRYQSQRKGCSPVLTQRYRPISMQLVAYLDGHYVEMRIQTDDGTSIVVTCPAGSICDIQQHIEQIILQCPEILRWNKTLESQTENCDRTNSSDAGNSILIKTT
jgi:hypothetical protein